MTLGCGSNVLVAGVAGAADDASFDEAGIAAAERMLGQTPPIVKRLASGRVRGKQVLSMKSIYTRAPIALSL